MPTLQLTRRLAVNPKQILVKIDQYAADNYVFIENLLTTRDLARRPMCITTFSLPKVGIAISNLQKN